MTRELWIRPTGRLDEVAGAALEAGADGVLVTEDEAAQVEGVGRLPTARIDGDTLTLGDREGRRVQITSPEDQEAAKRLLDKVDVLLVEADDWTIIPLENLIAWAQDGGARLFARVTDAEEAELALTTLETGVGGLVLETDDPATVHAVGGLLADREAGRIELVTAEVTEVEPAGMGDRVCVDTTSLLEPDEGLLVGSQSSLLALVASEASEAGYVASRPFRINAGAVHAYVLAPEDRTRYLSEVVAGVRVLAVDREGATRPVVTGRAKIERRPMLLVTVQTADGSGTLVLQNAETIRLVGPDGPTSVADLEPGDEVFVHLPGEHGRHFGTAVEETVREV